MDIFKKNYLGLVFAAACLTYSTANAAWTNVYCAKEDGSDWYWLKDGDDNPVTISGYWGRYPLANFRYAQYFSVYKREYNEVQSQCKDDYVAQPAANDKSGWYIFQVYSPYGDTYYAPGKYDVYDLTAREICHYGFC
ncbi:hypothetical protein [Spartinivicinus poritis]|uniref:Secreted protein n=1 Tax=Spartinivicinus poritis TaxID=2994640 RepID=A0ABT5UHB7_9GAMM|nr:hypothetical protein [Spartinivicinus sp. A2-2]MDE1465707.1 hypothetical protein [Spartinivicinus sp. A2-2]